MSGSLSYLTSLFSSSLGAGDSVLNALYGKGSAPTGQSALQALSTAEKTEKQQITQTAAQPVVQHTIAAFTQAVKGAKSLQQLLANPTVMNVLLTANGLKDQVGYTALATKVLTSNLSDPKSLANTLTDTRWKTLAQTYNFNAKGLSAIQNPTAIAAVASAYAKATWEASQDSVTPGLSTALAFKESASGVTSVDQILGSPVIREVVTTALGIPKQIAFQSLDAQEKAISSHVDITKFKDPKFVESLAQRYLIQNASSASSSAPDLITLATQARTGFA